MQSLGPGDFDRNSRVVDEATLLSATSEEPFSRESFECLKELAQSVVLTAGVQRLDDWGAPRPMTRDEAILAGLMARCNKLHSGLLDATAGRKMELLNFFVRGVVETAVNLRYLLEFGTPDVLLLPGSRSAASMPTTGRAGRREEFGGASKSSA